MDAENKIIALTFDDGPAVTVTGEILKKLKKYNIIASFFVVGNNINEETKNLVKSAFDMGCEINSHSYSHSDMTTLTAKQIKDEMENTSQKIQKIIGVKPKFFRPPYISVNKTMYDNINLPFIAGYGCNDWEDSVNAMQRTEKVLAQARDGGIILMHDMDKNYQTVQALDEIIPNLKNNGYEFVTVEQLFHLKAITPKVGSIVYSFAQQQTEYPSS